MSTVEEADVPRTDGAISTQLVIFGLTGDLARKKLIPALYHLTAAGVLAESTQIVGVTRRAVTAAEVLEFLHDDPVYDPAVVAKLAAMTGMFQMDLTKAADYAKLKTLLDQQEHDAGLCFHRLFYFSMPPQVFGPVIDLLAEADLSANCGHGAEGKASRLLIEKPFGFDLVSADELVRRLAAAFNEEQIFRIDHYVAKEASQNLLAFRSHNPLFQAAWNAEHIEHITITAAEKIGVEGRAAFYEQTGALRDLIQNHLLQLLALTTMETPTELTADHIHAAKLKLLKTVVAISPQNVATQAVRAQYEGYREEVGQLHSTTETCAAVRLAIDNDRWRGVPIVLQTGKQLDRKVTEIAINFKGVNDLIVRLEPDEGICLTVMVKKPGLDTVIEPVDMDFRYARSFTERQPDAYERVLADAMRGDRTLFTTSAETIECWRIVDAVVGEWGKSGAGLSTYAPGTPAAKIAQL